jgi:hypothetical protein
LQCIGAPIAAASLSVDWEEVADGVIQHGVEHVAVYVNPNNDIAIRQERRWDEEDDRFIVIARGNVLAFITKLQELIGIEVRTVDGEISPPTSKAAERQRRYRQRKRNGESVTHPYSTRRSDAAMSSIKSVKLRYAGNRPPPDEPWVWLTK